MNTKEKISAYIEQLQRTNLYRKRPPVTDHQNDFIQFSSNDYLSLSKDPDVREAYIEGYKTFDSGSGGSPVICGYQTPHKALEQTFADLLAVDDCLLFSSGYAANLAIARLIHILQLHACIDKGVHASLYDGLHLENISFSRYAHNNMQDFAHKIAKVPQNTIVITEGIFSMSGQQTPLQTLAQSGYPLCVDEAHSFGVIGAYGKGATAAAALHQDSVPLRVIPLGKACAGQGAIVAGQGLWIDALLQAARSLIYSTAPSPALVYGMEKTLHHVIAAEDKRQKLKDLILIFRQAIRLSPLRWTDSNTPIQQLITGDASIALELSSRLRETGIICMPVRYPTVHPQNNGLRIVLNAHHTPEHIQRLFDTLHRILA